MSDFVWIMIADLFFFFALAYYLMSNLQWYSYSIWRVLSKHHRPLWHFLLFVMPVVFYCTSFLGEWGKIGHLAFACVYCVSLLVWALRLDRPLKWTGRVWRFFGIFVLFALGYFAIELLYARIPGAFVFIFVLSLLVSHLLESLLLKRYKNLAQKKLTSMTQLKIILITASYGKTSIKNYLYQILRARFATYATPRSVNTLKGIIADINTYLNPRSDFYIVEAGARERGDIAEITEFLNPQFVIIGKIGPQHLEYFKTLENIVQTKFEALRSNRLNYALIESNNTLTRDLPKNALMASGEIYNLYASLEGTSFELLLDGERYAFQTQVLGSFNAYNIALCVEMAQKLGMNIQEISNRVKKLEAAPHRLNKVQVGGKIILDDSFNGNLEGMKEAIRISSEHSGRKVIVTPGIVESTDEMNIELAKRIDEVFDVVIITGELNAQILAQEIQGAKKILLKDKTQMENMLKATLKEGDLVLFANDAPNYI